MRPQLLRNVMCLCLLILAALNALNVVTRSATRKLSLFTHVACTVSCMSGLTTLLAVSVPPIKWPLPLHHPRSIHHESHYRQLHHPDVKRDHLVVTPRIPTLTMDPDCHRIVTGVYGILVTREGAGLAPRRRRPLRSNALPASSRINPSLRALSPTTSLPRCGRAWPTSRFSFRVTPPSRDRRPRPSPGEAPGSLSLPDSMSQRACADSSRVRSFETKL
jgi:hypothetical protein